MCPNDKANGSSECTVAMKKRLNKLCISKLLQNLKFLAVISSVKIDRETDCIFRNKSMQNTRSYYNHIVGLLFSRQYEFIVPFVSFVTRILLLIRWVISHYCNYSNNQNIMLHCMCSQFKTFFGWIHFFRNITVKFVLIFPLIFGKFYAHNMFENEIIWDDLSKMVHLKSSFESIRFLNILHSNSHCILWQFFSISCDCFPFVFHCFLCFFFAFALLTISTCSSDCIHQCSMYT